MATARESGDEMRIERRRGDTVMSLPCFQRADFDFENKQFLGSGGFGDVYLVRHISKNQMVVVKTPNHNILLALDMMKELMVLRRIRMRYIVEIYGLVISGNQLCGFALEHAPLGSVDDVVRKIGRKLPWTLQLRVMYQTAEAIKYLHEHRVLHLDLKTPNILLDENCEVKVADFGLSQTRAFTSTRLCWSELADSKVTGFTEYFLAPEIMRDQNRPASRKCDVYAFAITMWQILTGKWPFSSVPRGMHQVSLRHSIKDGLRPSTINIPQSTPQEKTVFNIMIQCWHHDPEQRPRFTGIVPDLQILSDEVANRARADAEEVKVGLQHFRRIEAALVAGGAAIVMEEEGELEMVVDVVGDQEIVDEGEGQEEIVDDVNGEDENEDDAVGLEENDDHGDGDGEEENKGEGDGDGEEENEDEGDGDVEEENEDDRDGDGEEENEDEGDGEEEVLLEQGPGSANEGLHQCSCNGACSCGRKSASHRDLGNLLQMIYIARESHTTTPADASESHTTTPADASESHTSTPADASESHTSTPSDARESHTSTPADARESHTTTPADARESHTSTPADARESHTTTPTDARESHTSTPADAHESHTTTPADARESHTQTSSDSYKSHEDQAVHVDKDQGARALTENEQTPRDLPMKEEDHRPATTQVGRLWMKGRNIAVKLNSVSRERIIAAGNTRPQPNSIVVNVFPNSDSSGIPQAELHEFAYKVLERFEQPVVWGMITWVFHNEGMSVQAARWGCIEIIFKCPIAADNANVLVSSIKHLEDALTKVSDFLGEPSFQRLSEKRIALENSRKYLKDETEVWDFLGKPSSRRQREKRIVMEDWHLKDETEPKRNDNASHMFSKGPAMNEPKGADDAYHMFTRGPDMNEPKSDHDAIPR